MVAPALLSRGKPGLRLVVEPFRDGRGSVRSADDPALLGRLPDKLIALQRRGEGRLLVLPEHLADTAQPNFAA